MITEEQIEKRRQEIIVENQAAAKKVKEKGRNDVLECLAEDDVIAAVRIADRAGILWEIPEEHLMMAAKQFFSEGVVSDWKLGIKICKHFSRMSVEAMRAETEILRLNDPDVSPMWKASRWGWERTRF